MGTTLQKYRGTLALIGPAIDNLAEDALSSGAIPETFTPLNSAFHITLVTKDELRNLPQAKISTIEHDTRNIFSIGVGGKPRAGVYWVAIIWAAGQRTRKQLGLPAKHFHITLSASNAHDIDKGVASLLPGQFPQEPSIELLDHLVFTFQALGQYQPAIEYSSQLILQDPGSYKGFLRLADAAFAEKQMKLAMLSYGCAYKRVSDDKVRTYCMKKIVDCSKDTEWGHVFQEHEISQLGVCKDISSHLLEPWAQELRDTLSEQMLNPTLLLQARQPLFIQWPTKPSQHPLDLYKLPRFFRWLIPYHLAVMSTPRTEGDIAALASAPLGIRHVLTLTEETPLPEAWFKNKRITNTYLPIPNYHPPSIEQMDLIMRLFDDEKNLPLLVHCGGGKGRAGTVAACYLAAYGFNKPNYTQDHPQLAASGAIAALRALRPGSLETRQQEAFVSTWCSTIWKRQSIYPDLPSEPLPSPMEVEGSLADDADLFILVGLPGSGKSWFSNALLARDPNGWVRISQDENGSRASCETEIGRTPPKGKRVLLDRCNMTPEDRKLWIALASNWLQSRPVCVWFDYDPALCVSRAQMRANHPTLRPGGRVRTAVQSMHKVFGQPMMKEGFSTVVRVRSFAAALEAVDRLSRVKIGIIKFPRTPHLIDVGAATDDDVHIDLTAFAARRSRAGGAGAGDSEPEQVVITEKIDGANMGFSLSSDRTRILVQNRSHYVNPTTHEQFKKLGAWVDTHDAGLRHILDRDPHFAERYILYGEWMYATHAIAYTNLPDLFVAFDLYDRSTGAWADSEKLRAVLDGTGIRSVPVLYEGGVMPSREELLGMIQQKSKFYEGRVEGVYVKVEVGGNGGGVKTRGKVVRGDFIAGNEHWTRRALKLNGFNSAGAR